MSSDTKNSGGPPGDTRDGGEMSSIPPYDKDAVRYCEIHEAHWIPWNGASEKGASCPWCARDTFWDELEDIYDAFLTAVRSSEGGLELHHGSPPFSHPRPADLHNMKQYLQRWGEVLGKNVRRGA